MHIKFSTFSRKVKHFSCKSGQVQMEKIDFHFSKYWKQNQNYMNALIRITDTHCAMLEFTQQKGYIYGYLYQLNNSNRQGFYEHSV